MSRRKASPVETSDAVVRGWLYAGDDCLLWPLGKSTRYGASVVFNGVSARPHEHVCELKNGTRPFGHDAAHECGNSLCYSGRHLTWKLPVANSADMERHGTVSHGEARFNARLSAVDAKTIRASVESGRALAARYGVHTMTISDIKTGKTWRRA